MTGRSRKEILNLYQRVPHLLASRAVEYAVPLIALVATAVISKWGIDYAAHHPDGYIALIVVLVDYLCLCVLWGVGILAVACLVKLLGWEVLLAAAAAGLFIRYNKLKQ
jgi:hypothetical protein